MTAVYSFFIRKHPGNTIAAIAILCSLLFFGTDSIKSLASSIITDYAAAVPDSKSQAIREAELAKLAPKDRPWMADGSALATVANWTFTVSKAAAEGLNYALYSDAMFMPSPFSVPPTQVVVEKDGQNQMQRPIGMTDTERWFKEYNNAIDKAASSPGHGGKTGERRLEGDQQPVNTAPPRDWRDFGPPRPGQRTVIIPDQQPADPRMKRFYIDGIPVEEISGGPPKGGQAELEGERKPSTTKRRGTYTIKQ